jgi:hypothetical protein
MKRLIFPFIIFFTVSFLQAQVNDGSASGNFFKASGSPVNPKVSISWNRYYTNEGLLEIYRSLVAAYPELISLQSIGKSHEGRDIWMLTVSNLRNQPHREKPAFYIDGGIHANEIQGSEISLYTAWYLVETYRKNNFITQLMDEKVFYIAPVTNPDGRDYFMKQPGTANSSRSGTMALDDDGDGLAGEDGFDDLNQDGHITMMRRATPFGLWKTDPGDPRRMIRTKPDEYGQWEMLGYEGIDRDGDGLVNEDRKDGFYDPNRDWGWNWQPAYVQGGALYYPFSLPETRAVRDFVMAHPNIAGAQTYHNTGGMILRGPGAAEDEKYYLPEDIGTYDFMGQLGARMIPGYNYMVLFRDLYTVYGGQIDWFHMSRGIFTFTNELFTSYFYFNQQPEGWNRWGSPEPYEFDKYLLFEDAFVPWQDFDHPQFGRIQIGGLKKNFGRINPGFMLEQEAHRNMAFTLFHAWHTPQIRISDVTTRDLGGGLKEITAIITNSRVIPTHSGIDRQNRIERPNYISLEGGTVLAGMVVQNRDLNIVREQKINPAVIEVENIPGMGTVTVRWIVNGGRRYNIRVDSPKGGIISREL